MNPEPGSKATAIGAMAGTAELTSVRVGGTCWLVDATIVMDGGGAGQVTNARMYQAPEQAAAAIAAMPANATVLYFPAKAEDEDETEPEA